MRFVRSLAGGLFLGLLLGIPLCGSAAEAESSSTGLESTRGSEKYFGEISLIDQNGVEHRLYSDLLKDKVVVINAMFTSCTGSCPVMAGRLVKVQRWLGDRLGKDAHILSISVDPTTDTPEKLASYAESFRARPGWYFLTGEKANVDAALRKLGQYVEDKETHLSVMIIGNEPTGLWKKAMGLADADEIVEIVQSVVEDRE
ncbi:MAG: SCO family protein [Deltaproteobacteria bacterium]|nr:SCO family protein [Deltaproteobacteria bacterium]